MMEKDGQQGVKAEKKFIILGEVAGERLSPSTLELLGLAAGLKGEEEFEIEALFLGKKARAAAEEACAYAGSVYLVEDPALDRYHPELYHDVLQRLCEIEMPAVLMASHSASGQDLLPRLCFTLGGTLVTDCTALSLEAGEGRLRLICSKPVYGGNAVALYALEKQPLMATVRPRVGEPPPLGSRSGKILPLTPPHITPRIELGKVTKEAFEGPKLENAGVVIAGGRGMAGEEGFKLLNDLAALLGGAVGGSRPACDAGWIPCSSQIGITGKLVAPDLYLAIGISGSSQHLMGMSDSGTIVAVNKDPEAEIFKVSSYGAVGEWQQVLPAFISALRRRLEGERG